MPENGIEIRWPTGVCKSLRVKYFMRHPASIKSSIVCQYVNNTSGSCLLSCGVLPKMNPFQSTTSTGQRKYGGRRCGFLPCSQPHNWLWQRLARASRWSTTSHRIPGTRSKCMSDPWSIKTYFYMFSNRQIALYIFSASAECESALTLPCYMFLLISGSSALS